MTDTESELIEVAKNAHALISGFYQWADKVKDAGGTTCISGISAAHAMLASMEKNKARVDKLVTNPLLAAIAKAEGRS